MTDIHRPLQPIGLTDKPALPLPIRQLYLAQPQRRRNGGQERSLLTAWQLPYFHRNRRATFLHSDHARAIGWATGQGIQLIVGGTVSGFEQTGSTLLELPVQRQPIQVRAADHQPCAIIARNIRRRRRGQPLLTLQGMRTNTPRFQL